MIKTDISKTSGLSRASLYYQPKQPFKDWQLKTRTEEALHECPSYGHKRLALHLGIGKSKILRVMKIFGIKPYRRRAKKPWKKIGKEKLIYSNLLLNNFPDCPGKIWASDFTHLRFKGGFVYLATIMDLFTREIVGFNVMASHGVSLVTGALLSALNLRAPPEILHSDQGSEYASKTYTALTSMFNIQISMSRRASPWENGYQESFYSHFKVDFGDPNRFDNLGELIYHIYQTVHTYNKDRIHSILKTSPRNYLNRYLAMHRVS